MPDLIAVGEVMLDVQAPELVPRSAVHAPLLLCAGGAPVNAALAAATLGARAAVIGRVGADAAAEIVRAELADAGVEALLAVDARRPTGTFLEAGDAVAADRGANAALSRRDLPTALEAAAVYVSPYAPADVARAAVERARADWVAGPGGTVFIGHEPPRERYRVVCVTAHASGATATMDGVTATRSPREIVPGRATGAGDAFAAGFLLGLARGLPLGDALELGCELGVTAARRRRSGAETASAGS